MGKGPSTEGRGERVGGRGKRNKGSGQRTKDRAQYGKILTLNGLFENVHFRQRKGIGMLL